MSHPMFTHGGFSDLKCVFIWLGLLSSVRGDRLSRFHQFLLIWTLSHYCAVSWRFLKLSSTATRSYPVSLTSFVVSLAWLDSPFPWKFTPPGHYCAPSWRQALMISLRLSSTGSHYFLASTILFVVWLLVGQSSEESSIITFSASKIRVSLVLSKTVFRRDGKKSSK